MAKYSGSKIIVECLLEQGVDTVFGYPGGAILNLYDELYKNQDRIRHILTSHEQGAAHAADGYARASGKVGVCLATSGPGATNLVTGIASAHMDSIPVVAITCNVGNNLLGKDSFQEVDIAGIVMPVTKYSFIVRDGNKLADTIRRAFKIAVTGRPGPVLIDITKDVTGDSFEYEYKAPEKVKPATEVEEEELLNAVSLIRASNKPYVLVGGGAILSGASEELKTFVSKVDCPVADTLMGKGAFDGSNEKYTGMVGMHGTKSSNLGITECDLLIVIGARFSDRVIGNAKKFARNAKILHIDVDAAEISKNIKADFCLIGDARLILRKLNSRLDPMHHDEWVAHIERLKDMYPIKMNKAGLTGEYIIETIDAKTADDTIISTEVGQHQMWTAQFYKFKNPRTLLTSGGLGTMGYGLGASIGAKVAKPDKTVVNIAGDGCFRMNMNEIATATRYDIPIIQVIINNHVLGMVRQWQNLYYGKRYSQTVLRDKVDFVKLAEAMGAKARRVTTKEEFDDAFDEALKSNTTFVIECEIDSDEKVFPMVSPGAAISDAFDEKDLKLNPVK
ncbi:acetolactate synthase [Lachnospiraceae oral taxon 107 str. F0167]|jgi:acetolactate synthase, large subunit, biosynthetic type|uniref:biosynthetic-type acetolactate synthase large subunit n=1 Tax=Lachnoanaerobaculum sp. Marseille-Q4761 TaxID=2819511 RepID=UPI0002083432|nr:biosynthetic-type acetolactate synthase large subunit [Lachnoanaerobaculum sp. Marseille-Q4761]EGG92479.1 acetolactate synthase [Lachnospiraceae oral taxon 107 str. F0167]MBO1869980.1 biosynthetic-type acetolactate synthase large subunit [Lachnoanaerobaculum sp. Marseille-Q4761]RKW36436.1 MAG: biosynthetic-type acetolactate synthase large subunit [Lachnospiraceae bacterium]